MSSKGNVYIRSTPTTGVYLYTQNDGQRLPKILQKALLRGRNRWGDSQAMARIIFTEMIQSDVLSNTGYGISTVLGDNDNYILVVDDKEEKIGIFTEDGTIRKSYTFAEFCNISDAYLGWRHLVGERYNDERIGRPIASGQDPYPFNQPARW